ncbi:ERBB receptor feedback inhibitor 1 [Amblyraja radiata]|uniref:ERBB receptor feedback inhibitor 1 n=1 Tax=Amblyraja radiata TaxID=386614 RepID=UPI001403DE7A|nr:ERBB receptor feedback inhibitor 1 [Amblyraja radiata]XP_032904097.1 ERBB receptor feedback inhibitor 1 [Amblyraja radiata]
MSSAGLAAQEIHSPLSNCFMHGTHGVINNKSCWNQSSTLDNTFFADTTAVTCALNAAPHKRPYSVPSTNRQDEEPFGLNRYCCFGRSSFHKIRPPPLKMQNSEESFVQLEKDQVLPHFKKLSVNSTGLSPPQTPVRGATALINVGCSSDRSSKPLPPLPFPCGEFFDDVDSEVESITNSETDLLLHDNRPLGFRYGAPSRRSFRGCGQANYAYSESISHTRLPESCHVIKDTCLENKEVTVQPVKPHRKLRRSHSGPAGSYNKPTVLKNASCLSNSLTNTSEVKPEIPPRVPIPPRPVKHDYRRWSAEVMSAMHCDEDKPPKVPPREPMSRSNSRTPSPKCLPAYLNGVMPPTRSFAPDPKYVSNKVLQRQASDGATPRVPCILPIIEDGKKVSSTHYYLLPERPLYLDKFEKYLVEAQASEESNDCTTESFKTFALSKPVTIKQKLVSNVDAP